MADVRKIHINFVRDDALIYSCLIDNLSASFHGDTYPNKLL